MQVKRYWFNVYNAGDEIINKISTVCNSLEVAKSKATYKVKLIYGPAACFARINFNYHETFEISKDKIALD